ncbi:DUF616 domain-containing protein [Desulfovibrio sp. OttesenSCG-928-C06]|nr:DUF616 domain-containing protein [Desulfovibrio sp. OttesenSCG-928-C06]
MRERCIIYSVLFGNYESINNPFGNFIPDCRRICFTDNPALTSDVWEVVLVSSNGLDPVREARRYKMQPNRYLPPAEWSLYIDNTISFIQPPEALLQYAIQSGGDFYCFEHPWRDCLYDEAEAVIMEEKDCEPRVREQIEHYRRAGFAAQAGLYASGILLRKHNAPEVSRLGELWFEHVLRFSKRDQLSLPVALKLSGCVANVLPWNLLDNEYIMWSLDQTRRIPAGFSPDVYRWLNPEADQPGITPEAHYLTNATSRTRYKRHFCALNSLANKYHSDKGDLYYNAHGYARVYEQYLLPLRNRPIRILEIGLLQHDVQKRQQPPYSEAPSLAMWREYLPKAEIFGFDMADFSAVPPMPGVSILRGDASSKSDLVELLKQTGGKFDMIIDNASHASHHQQLAMSILYGSLNPGGIYAIEDLSFQPQDLEISGLPRTKDIIRALQCGNLMPTPYISEKSLAYILETATDIQLYDSLSNLEAKVDNDAIAVIRRSK